MSKNANSSAELFKLDGKPSFGVAFPQALQHVLAMLVGNITPPMLIANLLEMTPEQRIMLTQAAMIIGGITTLLQLYPILGFGMGLPNVMGVAFAYMPNTGLRQFSVRSLWRALPRFLSGCFSEKYGAFSRRLSAARLF